MDNKKVKNDCLYTEDYFKRIGTFVTTTDGVTKLSTLNPYSNEFYPKHKLMENQEKQPPILNNYRWPAYKQNPNYRNEKSNYKKNIEKYPNSMTSCISMPRKFSLELIQESSEELVKEEHTKEGIPVDELFSKQNSFNDPCYTSVTEIKHHDTNCKEIYRLLKKNTSNLKCAEDYHDKRDNLNKANNEIVQTQDKTSDIIVKSIPKSFLETEQMPFVENSENPTSEFAKKGNFANKVDKVGDVPKLNEASPANEGVVVSASVTEDMSNKNPKNRLGKSSHCVLKKQNSSTSSNIKKSEKNVENKVVSPVLRRKKLNGTTLWSTLRRTSTLSLNSLKSINGKIRRGRFFEPVLRHPPGRVQVQVQVESKTKTITKYKTEQTQRKPSSSVLPVNSQSNNLSGNKSNNDCPSSSKIIVLTKDKVKASSSGIHTTGPVLKKIESSPKRVCQLKRTN